MTIMHPQNDRVLHLKARFYIVRIFLFLSLCLFSQLIATTATASSLPTYAVGENVCVQWAADWKWYEAQILELKADQARVHYPAWGSTWDEWVTLESINPRYAPTVGSTQWVEWNLGYYTATILSQSTSQYQVHYVNYDSSWDELVNQCRVFPLPKVGDPVWVKWRLDWYYAKVLETGTDSWKVHYVSYEDSWDEYVDPSRIMVCPPAQAAKAESSGTSSQAAPVPTATNFYTYPAVSKPVVNKDASKARPIGVGQVAGGGKTLTLQFFISPYAAGVDIYFGIQIPGDTTLYLLGPDGRFHPYSSDLIAMASNTIVPINQTILQDVSVAGFPLGLYSFYALVIPTGDLSSYEAWYTSFNLANAGAFTGQALLDATSLDNLLAPLLSDMIQKGSTAWYAQVEQFFTDYKNADGIKDPAEARYLFMWTAYLENNLYPFCWTAFKSVQAEPANAWVLNSAAVCLLELGELDIAGRVLDYANYQDASLSLTHENAAVYFDQKGNKTRAAQEKLNALNDEPSWAHDAWDGYHYAIRNGLTLAGTFDSLLPSNYSLQKSNGTQGSGQAKTRVCCSCSGKFYDNVVVCVNECSVSLACFTSICTPRLQCCGQKTPFGLESGFCYPPTGLQACIEADNAGNYTIKLGAKLGGQFGTYVGASTNFKNNYNVGFSFAGSSGAKAQVALLSSDPNTRLGASKFVWNPGVPIAGGFGLGANLEATSWPQSPICELNAPQTQ